MGQKLGVFCCFLKVASLFFLDIAQDCSLGQYLTSSKAITSKKTFCGPNWRQNDLFNDAEFWLKLPFLFLVFIEEISFKHFLFTKFRFFLFLFDQTDMKKWNSFKDYDVSVILRLWFRHVLSTLKTFLNYGKWSYGRYWRTNWKISRETWGVVYSALGLKYFSWANLVQKFKIVKIPRLIQICRIQCLCSLFFVFDKKQLFWANLVPKYKIVCLKWNLVPRLIRHLDQFEYANSLVCSFFLFLTGNVLFR